MAFVNEVIPEEIKDKFEFPVQVSHSGNKPTLWKWTIDTDRNAFLVHTKNEGGAYEGTPKTQYFILSWDDVLTEFSAESKIKGNIESGQILIWKIKSLKVLDKALGRRKDIVGLIKESLDAMGLLYNRDYVKQVVVEFEEHIKER